MTMLSVKDLSKSFGHRQVIHQLNMTVPEGSIFGFIGRNGSGKTTTMKMILGLLPADCGEIHVCGERVRFGKNTTNRYIGYLPDVPEFYNYMNAHQYLNLCGEIVGLNKKDCRKREEKVLSLVGLEEENNKIGTFSRGMKQRLGIAQALLTEPKLLICDEPTSALDPLGRKEILEILCALRGKTTVLFSTHILSDVERICDHVALLEHGHIVANGRLSGLKAMHQGKEGLILTFETSAALKHFKKNTLLQPYLLDQNENEYSIVLRHENIVLLQQKVLKELLEMNIYPIKMEIMSPSLEDIFMEVVQ